MQDTASKNQASENQVRAADPGQSTWLSANAGSGKTRVLTDRVARLLLAGTDPQRILCLTYTKAAASEMQNRLFTRLGEWAMLPEDTLRRALRTLGVDGAIDTDTLAKARRLFARAIETPGGLKIQTIHSFCAGLLRRFPLEARVSPNFAELDDRAAKLLREEIFEELAAGADIAAVDAIAGLVSGDDFGRFLEDLCRNSAGFSRNLSRDDALAFFDLPAGFEVGSACAIAFDGTEPDMFAHVIPVLETQSKTMVDLAGILREASIDKAPAAALQTFFDAFLFKNGGGHRAEAKTASVPTKKAQEALGGCLEALHGFMERVARAKASLIALAAAEKTIALHRFAAAFLPRYHARKADLGLLDFDDLISRTADLLADRSVAGWVLFRLDGGIDHVLVDEAQDTSPGQWQVIERLAEEFTSGESARVGTRTIFVVGDKKQSIYSFQGADLAAFDRMYAHFQRKYADVGVGLQNLSLEHSFRSSDAILRVVDLTFDERVDRGLGGAFKHIAYRTTLPGRVDLWPPVPKATEPQQDNWFDPTDILPDAHHTVVLAQQIATEICKILDTGTQIETRDGVRAVHAGDFLILVQRRSDLFQEIIRACKSEGLDIAGADRLKLGAELAVKDIAALLSFLSLPEDDLSLAAVLRSPLFGWSEAALYDLAHSRGDKTFLWAELRSRAADFPETVSVLQDLRDQADFLRPYDLIERMLTRHDGRRKLLARLGPEAEDGIDALISQALAFEQVEVPSLTGFLVWMETDDVEVKRRLNSASRSIRVMTVHGAKGLEAPIVILPDTAVRRDEIRDDVISAPDGTAIWRTKADESPPLIVAERERLTEKRREERMRLLYVAMTRAQSWLIVCAAGDVGEGSDSWYSLVGEAMTKAGAVDFVPPDAGSGQIAGKRVEYGRWPDTCATKSNEDEAKTGLPEWVQRPVQIYDAADAPMSPSALGGAKALPGEAGQDEEAAKRHGGRLHLLLEHLPDWPGSDWSKIAHDLLLTGSEGGATADEVAAALNEAGRVLTSPDMIGLCGEGVLREVEITARLPELGGRVLHGTIDCLLVDDSRILAVDFKSNAVVPETPGTIPHGILRQMGAYDAMLRQIFPDRQVETAILWTRTGRLMPLPTDIVRSALQSTPIP